MTRLAPRRRGFWLVALLVLAAWAVLHRAGWSAPERDIELRVLNGSDVALSDVMVGDKAYGDLAPGGASDYRHWRRARSSAYVSLRANGKPLVIQPLGFRPGDELADGSYTYVLTIKTASVPNTEGGPGSDVPFGYPVIELRQDVARR